MKAKPKVYLEIAKKVREARKSKNISQERVAMDAGLNRAYIGYIERGERKPSVETLEKIARVLSVRLKDLFDF